MTNDWNWRVGFLNGFGEAFWQELAGKVRKITRMVVVQGQGIAFMKSAPCVASDETLPQFESSGLVIEGKPVKDEMIPDLDRTWDGGMIVPGNGARIKLT